MSVSLRCSGSRTKNVTSAVSPPSPTTGSVVSSSTGGVVGATVSAVVSVVSPDGRSAVLTSAFEPHEAAHTTTASAAIQGLIIETVAERQRLQRVGSASASEEHHGSTGR